MTFKNIFVLIILISLCGLYSLLIRKGLRNQDLNLKTIQSFKGVVSNLGETVRTSGKYDSKVFFLKLTGLAQTLGVYRKNKDYSSLINQINVGDTLTIYFKTGEPEDVNIDLVQIERKEIIILDKNEYENKESYLIWIGAIAGILTLSFAVGHFLKNMRTK